MPKVIVTYRRGGTSNSYVVAVPNDLSKIVADLRCRVPDAIYVDHGKWLGKVPVDLKAPPRKCRT